MTGEDAALYNRKVDEMLQVASASGVCCMRGNEEIERHKPAKHDQFHVCSDGRAAAVDA